MCVGKCDTPGFIVLSGRLGPAPDPITVHLSLFVCLFVWLFVYLSAFISIPFTQNLPLSIDAHTNLNTLSVVALKPLISPNLSILTQRVAGMCQHHQFSHSVDTFWPSSNTGDTWKLRFCAFFFPPSDKAAERPKTVKIRLAWRGKDVDCKRCPCACFSVSHRLYLVSQFKIPRHTCSPCDR